MFVKSFYVLLFEHVRKIIVTTFFSTISTYDIKYLKKKSVENKRTLSCDEKSSRNYFKRSNVLKHTFGKMKKKRFLVSTLKEYSRSISLVDSGRIMKFRMRLNLLR